MMTELVDEVMAYLTGRSTVQPLPNVIFSHLRPVCGRACGAVRLTTRSDGRVVMWWLHGANPCSEDRTLAEACTVLNNGLRGYA